MTVIRWKFKNIIVLALLGALCLALYFMSTSKNLDTILYFIGVRASRDCNRNLRWIQDKRPLIGLLGPPGSGIVWLRYLVEQMTGIYTGSAGHEYVEQFVAEGHDKKVIAMMAYDVDDLLPRMEAGILLYRNMQDSVRTTFAQKQGPGAFFEAPLNAYYGKAWEKYATEQSQIWAVRYQGYLTCSKPMFILSYDELSDPKQIKNLLLRISNLLHVPIKHSVLECIVNNAMESELKPLALRTGFQPFSLLPIKELSALKQLANYTENGIKVARAKYRPRVHV